MSIQRQNLHYTVLNFHVFISSNGIFLSHILLHSLSLYAFLFFPFQFSFSGSYCVFSRFLSRVCFNRRPFYVISSSPFCIRSISCTFPFLFFIFLFTSFLCSLFTEESFSLSPCSVFQPPFYVLLIILNYKLGGLFWWNFRLFHFPAS